MCNKMSDVRLSNASPTLERVDARQPDNARPPVSRNLFGTPDPEERQRYFRAAMQEAQRAFAERWDYDPVTDRPLSPRNYEWERVTDPPDYFVRPPHRRQRPRENEDLHGDSNPQDAGESSERQSDPQAARLGSRKRPSGGSGGCASECQSKRSHTDEDDDGDEDQPGCPGRQTVTCAEQQQAPSRPDDRTLLH